MSRQRATGPPPAFEPFELFALFALIGLATSPPPAFKPFEPFELFALIGLATGPPPALTVLFAVFEGSSAGGGSSRRGVSGDGSGVPGPTSAVGRSRKASPCHRMRARTPPSE